MSVRRIGILGGTFDPIHCGHIDAALAAESALQLRQLLVIPSHVPPHRQAPHASGYHRFAMAGLAVAGRNGWRASDLELRSEAESFTSETLLKFHERGYTPAELFFIIGADAFSEIASWKNYPTVLEYAHFAVVSRPGHPISDLPRRLPALAGRMVKPPLDGTSLHDPMIVTIDAPTSNVSATAIRDRRARDESIAGLVPDPVRQHIEQHGLYTSRTPGRRASDTPFEPATERVHGKD
jgi:nicotinate-nucleotide adenylyltransferase